MFVFYRLRAMLRHVAHWGTDWHIQIKRVANSSCLFWHYYSPISSHFVCKCSALHLATCDIARQLRHNWRHSRWLISIWRSQVALSARNRQIDWFFRERIDILHNLRKCADSLALIACFVIMQVKICQLSNICLWQRHEGLVLGLHSQITEHIHPYMSNLNAYTKIASLIG